MEHLNINQNNILTNSYNVFICSQDQPHVCSNEGVWNFPTTAVLLCQQDLGNMKMPTDWTGIQKEASLAMSPLIIWNYARIDFQGESSVSHTHKKKM